MGFFRLEAADYLGNKASNKVSAFDLRNDPLSTTSAKLYFGARDDTFGLEVPPSGSDPALYPLD
ncbi:MAG: hypothetical protein K9L88_12070, partial [Chromatiaceae bacterium]|nr:hypothetical protein [Chromatiaceae bacterium]